MHTACFLIHSHISLALKKTTCGIFLSKSNARGKIKENRNKNETWLTLNFI